MVEPRRYQAIMLSSTFTDLQQHRLRTIEAIQKFGFKANVMEHDGARADVDVIDSSLQMVRDSAAYVGVIGTKYGQVPRDPERNPDEVSITELEFREAKRLHRPIVLFIMGAKHPVLEDDVELDPDKRRKLKEFRETAKRMRDDGDVERVYEVFESFEQFSAAVSVAIGRLAHLVPSQVQTETVVQPAGTELVSDSEPALPRAPEFLALPRYLGSHSFVGRQSELQTLTEWSGEADPDPILLFEAMGGSGKSMLTWEWATKHALTSRPDWAGRFWYSFYEKGAVMADFCRHALAYITGQPVAAFAKTPMSKLSEHLVTELQTKPWLLVLDGLERILVAYHRYDAAQLSDDQVDNATDQIGRRDPTSAIIPDDDELLRRLSAAAPSKILITSRLTPKALVNQSGIQVPGVRRELLPGLRPPDAEAMIRACGVFGDSQTLRGYLQTNCGCHPLVVGVLAGLINEYPADRGNFDRWVADPLYGAALNLAELDLVQRRNHILEVAIDNLDDESLKLLKTLALLQGEADFDTLIALSLPLGPDETQEPADPRNSHSWERLHTAQQRTLSERYSVKLAKRRTYHKNALGPQNTQSTHQIITVVGRTLLTLEKRGLLQYDNFEKTYDLHPVVRGVTAGKMSTAETKKFGQRVVDHFTSRPHNPWNQAEQLSELNSVLQVISTYCRMGEFKRAYLLIEGEVRDSLVYNLDAISELQSILRPFFPSGWKEPPISLNSFQTSLLFMFASEANLRDSPDLSLYLLGQSIEVHLSSNEINPFFISDFLINTSIVLSSQNRLADAARISEIAQRHALTVPNNPGLLFAAKVSLYELAVRFGNERLADIYRNEIEELGLDWPRALYRPGSIEITDANRLLNKGRLTEDALDHASKVSHDAHVRSHIERVKYIRAHWHLSNGRAELAADCFAECYAMQLEVGGWNPSTEAYWTIARLRSGDPSNARETAERLTPPDDRTALGVAMLWMELGEREMAIRFALQAHRRTVADGAPYVNWYSLKCCEDLLAELRTPVPCVPSYDSTQHSPFSWEPAILEFIEQSETRNDAENNTGSR